MNKNYVKTALLHPEILDPGNKYKAMFECLGQIKPWHNYIDPRAVEDIHSSILNRKGRFKNDVNLLKRFIVRTMKQYGFIKLGGGTNRLVFRYLEDTRFVAKVAIDQVGLNDNPSEMRTQEYLKPFCTKMFQVTPKGTIGFAERVNPITSRKVFAAYSSEIYDILYLKISDYIMEDVGTKYFKNWGISDNRGPVLLDYPYVYPINISKLICPICHGRIDYDYGINEIKCSNCGKRYYAVQLENTNHKLPIKEHEIYTNGGNHMEVEVILNGKVIRSSNTSETIPEYDNDTTSDNNDGVHIRSKFIPNNNKNNKTEENKK